jgi:large subunit ribosomal protein L4
MKVEVYDLLSSKAGEIDLEDSVFSVPVRPHLFWEVVNWQRAKRRAGTHSVKSRGQVRGGGQKPWRQKGTGRARQGTRTAGQWVGGGVIHGPTPRDYSYRIPKKKRRAALCSALSMKVLEGKIRVVENLDFPEIKTKQVVRLLEAFDAPKALFVDVTSRDEASNLVQHNESLRLSIRNLKNAKYLAVEGLNVEDLLGYEYLFVSRSAVERLQEALKR